MTPPVIRARGFEQGNIYFSIVKKLHNRFLTRSATYDGTQKSPRKASLNNVIKSNVIVEQALIPGVMAAHDADHSSKQFLFDVDHDLLPLNTSFLQPIDIYKKVHMNFFYIALHTITHYYRYQATHQRILVPRLET